MNHTFLKFFLLIFFSAGELRASIFFATTSKLFDDSITSNEDDEDVISRRSDRGSKPGFDSSDELDISQVQLRARFKHGVNLGLGATYPWQNIVIEGMHFLESRAEIVPIISLGYGKINSEFNNENRSFFIKAQTRGFGLGVNYFFSETFPLFVNFHTQYLFWQGDCEPQGSDVSSTPEVTARLRSGFTAQGMTSGFKLGISYAWNNGIYIEYQFLGIARSWLISQELANPNSDLNKTIKSYFESTHFWGFINFKIGYLF